MWIVKFTDDSGKRHEHEYEYKSSATMFYEHMKEYYPHSNPVIIEN